MTKHLNKKLYFLIICSFFLATCSSQMIENKSIFEITFTKKDELIKHGFQQKILTISNGKVDTVPSKFGLINVIKDTLIECWLCNSRSDVKMEKISLPLKKIDTTSLNTFFLKLGFSKTNSSSDNNDYLLISAKGDIKYHVQLYKTHIAFIREFACPKEDSNNISPPDSVN